MFTLFVSTATAWLLAFALTPLARHFARRFGFVDSPDGKRKLQAKPVALWGGVAVYAGLCGGLFAAWCWHHPSEPIPARLPIVLAMAGGLLALAGLLDDGLELRPRSKLLLQILAVSPLVIADYFPHRLTAFGYEWEFGWWAAPVAMLWLVACVNAMNLLDGMDGFASVIGVVIAIACGSLALAAGNYAVGIAAFVLAGAITGFLPWNLPPASIYLGDAGSMLIGLALGTCTMLAADRSHALPLVWPLALMAIPLWDCVLAMVRRRLRGLPISKPDREHFHHRLQQRGVTHHQALAIAGGAACLTSLAPLVTASTGSELLGVAIVASVLPGLALCRLCGDREVRDAWALMRAKAALRLPRRSQPSPYWRPFIGKLQQMLPQGVAVEAAVHRHGEVVWEQFAPGNAPGEEGEWDLHLAHSLDAASCEVRLRTTLKAIDASLSLRVAVLIDAFVQQQLAWLQSSGALPSAPLPETAPQEVQPDVAAGQQVPVLKVRSSQAAAQASPRKAA